MRTLALALMVASLAPALALADGSCGVNERRFNAGEPCIPAAMAAYLVCLSHSGNGRIEVATTDEVSGDKKLNIKVAGSGSGVVVKGSGSVDVGLADASRAVKQFREQLDSSLASKCQDLANAVSAPVPTPPPKTAMGPLLRGVGLDHSDIDASGWLSLKTPEACRDMCYVRSDCKAMTYVVSNQSCWLKYEVPQRSAVRDEISSIKQ